MCCDVCALGRCARSGVPGERLSNSYRKELQFRACLFITQLVAALSLRDNLFSDVGGISALPCVRDGEKIESDVG